LKPHITGSEALCSGRFLAYKKLTYTDAKGISRTWEAVDRTGSSGEAHAVFIVAKIVPDDEIVLVRQFRPPAGRLMVEFPAGLIDPGETPEETAHRELYEETGYKGKILAVTQPAYSSPGLTGEPISCVQMEIDGEAYRGQTVEAHPEEVECIEVFRVPLENLAGFVAAQEAAGVGVDTKIHMLIAGLELGKLR
jgi:8-oxo-dGTP pyrophosphatase MutT (NUDIX family)